MTHITENGEKLYTLKEATKILNQRRRNRMMHKRYIMINMIKQKIYGVIMILIGTSVSLFIGDLTPALFCIPFGFWIAVTNKHLW